MLKRRASRTMWQTIAVFALLLSKHAQAYCWTRSTPGLVNALQREVERDPYAALRRVDQELAKLGGGKQDPNLGAWLYAIRAAAYYQLNGTDTVRDAAERGLHLLGSRHGSAALDLRLALLNSMNTPDELERAIPEFDAAERAAGSATARICVMILRGDARATLPDVHGAVTDLTNAYVQSQDLSPDAPLLRAYSATRLASILSRRLLPNIASPMFDDALAIYKNEDLTFDTLTTYIQLGLTQSYDEQAAEAIKSFDALLSSKHLSLISDDILAVVQAHLCQSYARLGQLNLADQACAASERLMHNINTPTWYVVHSIRADLALRRHQPGEALAQLDKAQKWRMGSPSGRELDIRARAYAALGQPAKAAPLWIKYVDLVREQDRVDRSFFADAWRARVFALEKEGERLRLSRSLALSRERTAAQRRQIAIIIFASTAIIFLLMAILLISRRARAKTLQLTQELQQQARNKIRMISHISHEIRSPLGSMTLVARALRAHGESSPQTKDLLSRMDRNGERISRLLADMLDYSRIEAGQLSLKPGNVAIGPLLEEVLEPYRADANQKGLELELSVENDVPTTIWCDGQRLFQILDNLVANAVRFTDRGSVGIRAKMLSNTTLQLNIEDTGVGIPPDQLQQLFADFQQVQSALHSRGGTGLGLVISRTLATAMGGTLDLHASPDGGLTASLRIPAKSDTSQADESPLERHN